MAVGLPEYTCGAGAKSVISVEECDGVAVVRLDDGKVNALDLELLTAISATMDRLVDVPAVVLTGAGTVFSAGVDLRRIVEGGPAYVRQFLPELSRAFLAVFDHPRPVVAAVNGHALAGGCVLAAACDVRLMSGGRIGLTELLVGVPFPITPLEIMRFAVGPAVAGLALTGRTMAPAEASRIGLVDTVVEHEELVPEAVRRAASLGRMRAAAYALTKEQLHRVTRQRIEELRPVDDGRAAGLWESDEARAAVAQYLDRLRKERPTRPD